MEVGEKNFPWNPCVLAIHEAAVQNSVDLDFSKPAAVLFPFKKWFSQNGAKEFSTVDNARVSTAIQRRAEVVIKLCN